MPVSFAPTNPVSYPPYGTPPINPENKIPKAPDYLIDAIREKAPIIAAILSAPPAGCDMPDQGGISGTLNHPYPKTPGVCYLA